MDRTKDVSSVVPAAAGRAVEELQEFRVQGLDAAVPDERRAWLDLWRRWPGREIMAHPDFGRLFARSCDRLVCVSARTERGGILFPMLVRPLAAEPWSGGAGDEVDLTTPYGYGGPFAWNVEPDEMARFWDAFDAWAASLRAATLFARRALFPERLLPFRGETVEHGPNVVVRLDGSEDDLWRRHAGKVRQNVRRARAEGVTIEIDADGRRLDEFLDVYADTMERRGALSQYRFPRAFFEELFRGLGADCRLLHAISGGRVVSSELLLLSADVGYAFLGGTRAEAFALRPNDLLKHEEMKYVRSLGRRGLVLGGSYKPGDELLRYKAAFDPGGLVPFRLGLRTFDPETSLRLSERRRAWERAQGRAWSPVPAFFPPYRS